MTAAIGKPKVSPYYRKVMVYDRYPSKNGYYKVSFKRSQMITDQLFMNDDVTKKVWFNQIEWWQEQIEEPFALTKEEALEKLRQDDTFIKMILECYFVGKEDKYRTPLKPEIELLKKYLRESK